MKHGGWLLASDTYGNARARPLDVVDALRDRPCMPLNDDLSGNGHAQSAA
jgi:hypothetical protein